jgi:hypothetical protein
MAKLINKDFTELAADGIASKIMQIASKINHLHKQKNGKLSTHMV